MAETLAITGDGRLPGYGALREGEPPRDGVGIAPLRAVIAFTFLSSIGNAVCYTGIYFITQTALGFTSAMNFLLALSWGVVYIPAALAVGPLLRRLRGHGTGMSPRGFVAVILLCMASLCSLPIAASVMAGEVVAWPVWVLIVGYSVLSGALWPVIESFLAGGRTDRQLASATGRFNIAWASAIVLAMLCIGPFIERSAFAVLLGLAVMHVATLGLLRVFPAVPAKHIHEDGMTAGSPGIVDRQLLVIFRMLLPASFVVISMLSPYLPTVTSKIGVVGGWETAVAAVWLAGRVTSFVMMERWHGWRGRLLTPVVAGGLLVVSFGAIVLSPGIAERGPAFGVLLAGLAGFGVAAGVIYASALYYAMHVGSAEVDAGGMHEALIGVGFSGGPLCGLAAIGLVEAGVIGAAGAETAMAVMVGVVVVGAGVIAGLRIAKMKAAREGGPGAFPPSQPGALPPV